jgi:poly(3-hydroxybutyrate) depolymerase
MNATSVILNGAAAAPNGSQTVSPSATTSYRLVATGSGGVQATADATLTVTSAGCSNGATGVFNTAMLVNGVSRSWVTSVPTTAASSCVPFKVVFAFHGSGGNGTTSRSSLLPLEFYSAEKAIFIYPDGAGVPPGGCTSVPSGQTTNFGWTCTSSSEDLIFFDQLLNWVSSNYNVDTSKVFVTGFSAGGFFATTVACFRNTSIRAAAIMSGGMALPFGSCESTGGGRLPMMFSGGYDDNVYLTYTAPAQGTPTSALPPGSDTNVALIHWLDKNGLAYSGPTISVPIPAPPPGLSTTNTTNCLDYVTSGAQAPIRWCQTNSSGPLGHRPGEWDVQGPMWDFFDHLP